VENFRQNAPPVDIGAIGSPTTAPEAPPVKPCAIVECLPPSNETICSDKSTTCGDSIPTTLSSPTSAADSTTVAGGCFPYWNQWCGEASRKLWLPTATDWCASGSNLSNGCAPVSTPKSWFSIRQLQNPTPNANSSKIWSQSLPCFPANSTGNVSIPEKSVDPKLPQKSKTSKKSKKLNPNEIRLCRKIRVFPTVSQKALLKQWFGVSRWVYNLTVTMLKEPGTRAAWKSIKTGIIHGLPEWCGEVPYQIKSIAIRDACQAVSNAKKKYLKTKEYQEVKYRNRYRKQSFFVPLTAISKHGVYHTVLGQLTMAERLPENPRDSRLILERGEYFVSVPYTTRRDCIAPKPEGVAAIDPGARTFLSVYSPNQVTDIGTGDFAKIFRLCQHLDSLVSRIASAKQLKQRKHLRGLKRAADKLRNRIRNLVNELHHQSAAWLTKMYSHIAFPDFNFHSVASRENGRLRVLTDKSVRNLATFAHGRFRETLRHHCNKRGVVLGCGSEAYTSKTDPFDGTRRDIRGRKILKLSNGNRYLRDNIGAFGIFLRALSDTTWVWQHTLQKPAESECTDLSGF
jgi:putative transposase